MALTGALLLPLGVAPGLVVSLPQAASDRPASATTATPTTKDPRTRRNAGLLSPNGLAPDWIGLTGSDRGDPRCESDHDSALTAGWDPNVPPEATSLYPRRPGPDQVAAETVLRGGRPAPLLARSAHPRRRPVACLLCLPGPSPS